MKRPKHVRVFGKEYSILWDNEDLDDGVAGDHAQKLLAIRICRGLAQDEERETLLHELTHAIEHQLGLNVRENQVRQLSVGIYGLLRDNPKLRAYLFGSRP